MPSSDTLLALTQNRDYAYKIYLNASGELTRFISKTIGNRIVQLYEKTVRWYGGHRDSFTYTVNLPFSIDIEDDRYKAVKYYDPGENKCNDSIAIYKNSDDHRGRLVTDEIAEFVYDQLQRMGFWDENYVFDISKE